MPDVAAGTKRAVRTAALFACLLGLFLALSGTIAPIEIGVGALAALMALGSVRLLRDVRAAEPARVGRTARLLVGTLAATARDCVFVTAAIAKGLAHGRQPTGAFSRIEAAPRALDVFRHSLPPDSYVVTTCEEGMLGHNLLSPEPAHAQRREGAPSAVEHREQNRENPS